MLVKRVSLVAITSDIDHTPAVPGLDYRKASNGDTFKAA